MSVHSVPRVHASPEILGLNLLWSLHAFEHNNHRRCLGGNAPDRPKHKRGILLPGAGGLARAMLDVLYEDNHCLVVCKPAGLLSQADVTGDLSLVDLVKQDLNDRFNKPGNVYLGLIHRLDRPVSGVVLLARTSKAADRLSAQFRSGTIQKTYWAWVEGKFNEAEGEWVDHLLKDAGRNVVETVEADEGGKEARLHVRLIAQASRTSLVELKPHTGRSHQLRVQLASRGWPIVGDKKYGASRSFFATDGGPRIALHAYSLVFKHPITQQSIEVTAPIPGDWPSY